MVSGAQGGVIYFSLGSNMKSTSLLEDIRKYFISAFAMFPTCRVVWKWESDTMSPGESRNIMFKKWIPQQDILAHRNTKLFMTQAGLQSLQEAIHYAVPVISIPLFGDQEKNAQKAADLEIGITLDFYSITNETVYKAVYTIISDKRYNENVLKISALSKDRLQSPLEKGVWWVEYVLRHNGASHLQPATLHLNWVQYLMLDIVVISVLLIFTLLFIIYSLYKCVVKVLLN